MGDFSNFSNIIRINEILRFIDPLQNTINLNNNCIRKANLNILPENITNVYLNNNMVNVVSWDNRSWGTISIKSNNFDAGEFDGFECDKLILDNNEIKEITFVNCKINNLSIVNNFIVNINFFDCHIKSLDLSANKITNIITLPFDLEKLNIDGNKIKDISTKLSDSIIHLDLSDNKLNKIPNIPNSIKYLDLSKNNFESFDPSIIPTTVEFFDITDNKIKNNTKLFKKLSLNVEKIYYDSDSEDDDNKLITDELLQSSETSEISNVSELSSVKFNYAKEKLFDNYREIKIESESESNSNIEECFNDFDNDDEINNAISEYKKLQNLENIESEQINTENNLNLFNDLDNDLNNDLNNDLDNVVSQRELLLKAAIDRFRNNNMNNIHLNVNTNTEVYLPLIPVKLKWDINLN